MKTRPGSSARQGSGNPGPVTPTSFLPGCCHQWCRDPAALPAHGPCRLPPQVRWQLAYNNRGGVSGCPPGPRPPSPLRQRLCSVPGVQNGPPATAAAPKQPASAPQPPPRPTMSPATAAPAMASGGPAPPRAAGTLLEPSRPSDARPLPAPAACGSFTYSSGAYPVLLRARPCRLSPLPRCPGLLLPNPPASPLTLVPVSGLGGGLLLPARASASPVGIQSCQARPALSMGPLSGPARGLGPGRLPLLTALLCFLSSRPSLPPARQARENLGQGVTSTSLLASPGVGQTVKHAAKARGRDWPGGWREQRGQGRDPSIHPSWDWTAVLGAQLCSGGAGWGDGREQGRGCPPHTELTISRRRRGAGYRP